MFDKIKTRWREARSVELRKEVEDSILRLNGSGQEVNVMACTSMADGYKVIRQQFGPLENVSDKGKKQIIKMLLSKARGRFDFNMGQGYGLFLLAAYFESQILPGEDALFVKEVTADMLKAAIDTTDNMEDYLK